MVKLRLKNKNLTPNNFYAEFKPAPEFKDFVESIYCLKDDGCLTSINKAVLASNTTDLRFYYPSSSKGTSLPHQVNENICPFPKISIKKPTSSYKKRNSNFNGWLFGVRFNYACDKTLRKISPQTLSLVLKSQRQIIMGEQDINHCAPSFEKLCHEIKSKYLSANEQAKMNLHDLWSSYENAEQKTRTQDLANQLSISQRTLQRKTIDYFGLTPKKLLMVKRLKEVLSKTLHNSEKLSNPNFIHEFMGSDYVDQSHFSKEFKVSVGMPPGEFAKNWRDELKSKSVQILQDKHKEGDLKTLFWK